MSSPELFWRQPDDLEVRVQLFAIMLGDQFLASAAAQSKSSRQGRRGSAKKTQTAPRPESPSCFNNIHHDPMLSLCLSPLRLNAHGTEYMREIYTFALACSPKMERYMKTTYETLLSTTDQAIMMAAIFFYVSWHFEYNEETGEISSNKKIKNLPRGSLVETLNFDMDTLNEIYDAAYAFERGRNEMTTMKSFVHSLVTNHYKRVT